jgi:hypothetical protein
MSRSAIQNGTLPAPRLTSRTRSCSLSYVQNAGVASGSCNERHWQQHCDPEVSVCAGQESGQEWDGI